MKTSIKLSLIIIVFMLFSSSLAGKDSNSISMYIPDGQISGKYLKVFIPEQTISKDMKPTLILRRPLVNKHQTFKDVGMLTSNQLLKEEIDGIELTTIGTWIYFDIRKIIIPKFYTSLRVIPVITWEEKETRREKVLVYPSFYFIGNGFGTTIWTFITIAIILAGLIVIFSNRKTQFTGIVLEKNGLMSMALLQMALWTFAIGSMVLAFGLLGQEVPKIPDSLIYLMLFAAGTATAGQIQAKIIEREEKTLKNLKREKNIKISIEEEKLKNLRSKEKLKNIDELVKNIINIKEKEDPNPNENNFDGFIGKLRSVFYTNKEDMYPSLAKVQVFFWTIITLVLFVYLSINGQKLWEVPNELVILMGISQVTFLGRQQMSLNEAQLEVRKEKPGETNNGENKNALKKE